jgi:hypothetical protein
MEAHHNNRDKSKLVHEMQMQNSQLVSTQNDCFIVSLFFASINDCIVLGRLNDRIIGMELQQGTHKQFEN